MATKACGATEKNAARKRKKRDYRAQIANLKVYFGELSPIAVYRREQRCCRRASVSFFVASGAVEGPHRLCENFLNGGHLPGANNSDSVYEDLGKGATHSLGRTFHFLENSENHVVGPSAVAVKVSHLPRAKACSKSKQSCAERFFKSNLVQRGRFEVHQHQIDFLVRQLLTDASKSLIALFARSKVNGDGGSRRYLTILYVYEQPVLLKFLDQLGEDDVAGARQGVALHKKTAADNDGDHAVKKGKRISGGRRLIERLLGEDHVLVGEKCAVFPGPKLQTSPFGEACQVNSGVIDGFAH